MGAFACSLSSSLPHPFSVSRPFSLAGIMVSEKRFPAADRRPVHVQQRRTLPGGTYAAPGQLGAPDQEYAARGRGLLRVPNHDPSTAIHIRRTENCRWVWNGRTCLSEIWARLDRIFWPRTWSGLFSIFAEAIAEIIEAPDLHINVGSTLRLECKLKRATESPLYVFWYDFIMLYLCSHTANNPFVYRERDR